MTAIKYNATSIIGTVFRAFYDRIAPSAGVLAGFSAILGWWHLRQTLGLYGLDVTDFATIPDLIINGISRSLLFIAIALLLIGFLDIIFTLRSIVGFIFSSFVLGIFVLFKLPINWIWILSAFLLGMIIDLVFGYLRITAKKNNTTSTASGKFTRFPANASLKRLFLTKRTGAWIAPVLLLFFFSVALIWVDLTAVKACRGRLQGKPQPDDCSSSYPPRNFLASQLISLDMRLHELFNVDEVSKPVVAIRTISPLANRDKLLPILSLSNFHIFLDAASNIAVVYPAGQIRTITYSKQQFTRLDEIKSSLGLDFLTIESPEAGRIDFVDDPTFVVSVEGNSSGPEFALNRSTSTFLSLGNQCQEMSFTSISKPDKLIALEFQSAVDFIENTGDACEYSRKDSKLLVLNQNCMGNQEIVAQWAARVVNSLNTNDFVESTTFPRFLIVGQTSSAGAAVPNSILSRQRGEAAHQYVMREIHRLTDETNLLSKNERILIKSRADKHVKYIGVGEIFARRVNMDFGEDRAAKLYECNPDWESR